jgi:3-oxoacyl-(acyl-carrier-protein) synthase
LNLLTYHIEIVVALVGGGPAGLVAGYFLAKGGMRMDPFYMLKMLPNMAAAHVALTFGLQGHNNTNITACAASTQAIGEAMEVVSQAGVEGPCRRRLPGKTVAHRSDCVAAHVQFHGL